MNSTSSGKMWAQKNYLPSVTIAFCFFLFHSPTFTAEAPKSVEYQLVKDFCSKRRTSDDRNFCLGIFESNPESASAEDYSKLLKIAINAALDNAKKSIDVFDKLLNFKKTKPALKSVLKDCISVYKVVVNEFLGINKKLGVKSSLIASDAYVANDEIRGCQRVLLSSNISEPFISNRNRIANYYGVLVEDLANLV